MPHPVVCYTEEPYTGPSELAKTFHHARRRLQPTTPPRAALSPFCVPRSSREQRSGMIAADLCAEREIITQGDVIALDIIEQSDF